MFIYTPSAYAESLYVLPYPSSMPGSNFYDLQALQEKVMAYWYFGDFGRFSYNLRYSDKYLVEAKTLFEYKQYLLGYEALNKSNQYYRNISSALNDASNNKKVVDEKQEIFDAASEKHVEILEKMKSELPHSFLWIPEKGMKSDLQIELLISESIKQRTIE